LFRDGSKAKEAAEAMKITAQDLFNLKIIDEIVKEPLGGAHFDPEKTADNIKSALLKSLKRYENMTQAQISQDRYEKFRDMGVISELATETKKCSARPQKQRKTKKLKINDDR
jgi:acetyl-CoA carboxylase carboxyl transferase subunit alpha